MELFDMMIEFDNIQLESVMLWNEIEKSAILEEAKIIIEAGEGEKSSAKAKMVGNAKNKGAKLVAFFQGIFKKITTWFNNITAKISARIKSLKGAKANIQEGTTTVDFAALTGAVEDAANKVNQDKYDEAVDTVKNAKEKTTNNKGKIASGFSTFISKLSRLLSIVVGLSKKLKAKINEGHSKAKQAVSSGGETGLALSQAVQAQADYNKLQKAVSAIISAIVKMFAEAGRLIKGTAKKVVDKVKSKKDSNEIEGVEYTVEDVSFEELLESLSLESIELEDMDLDNEIEEAFELFEEACKPKKESKDEDDEDDDKDDDEDDEDKDDKKEACKAKKEACGKVKKEDIDLESEIVDFELELESMLIDLEDL